MKKVFTFFVLVVMMAIVCSATAEAEIYGMSKYSYEVCKEQAVVVERAKLRELCADGDNSDAVEYLRKLFGVPDGLEMMFQLIAETDDGEELWMCGWYPANQGWMKPDYRVRVIVKYMMVVLK